MPAFYIIQKKKSSFAQGEKSRYYPIAKSWDRIRFDTLTEHMVRNTSLSKQEAVSALEYLQQSIPHFLEMGHTIDLGNLGRLQLAFSSEGSDTEEEASWRNIKDIRVRFIPSKELRERVRAIPVAQFPEKGDLVNASGYNAAMRKAQKETEEKTSREAALRCLAEGLTIEQAARISGLSEEEIESISREPF